MSDINYKSCVFLLKYYKSSPHKIRMQVDKNTWKKHKEGIRIPYR